MASPISARKTRLFCPVAGNSDEDGSAQDVLDFSLQTFNENRTIVESQKPKDLPMDLEVDASFPADRGSLAYRKLPREMVLGFPYVG